MNLSSFNEIATKLRAQNSSAHQLVHQRYVYDLVKLAKSKIASKFNGKIDPEDVVQSVFNSFFMRHKTGKVNPQNWNELWSLLATMTVRRCYRKTDRFRSEKRNICREMNVGNGEITERVRFDTADRRPTPEEQLIFEETFSRLLEPLTELQREIIALKLSGYTKTEISREICRTERTVHRAFKRIRSQLGVLQKEIDLETTSTPTNESF